MSEPLLSVVIPAYNAAKYVLEALTSVVEQLPRESEVIVVDDGSTDSTAAVVQAFGPPVRLIQAAHQGIGATVNRGMEEARGSFIAGMDADDRWLPGKVARSLALFESEPATEAVFTLLRQFASPDLENPSRFEIPADPIPGITRSNMIIRRSAWLRLGPLDTDLSTVEFVSWYARAMERGLVTSMIPEVLYERRIHGANTTIRERETAQNDYLRILRATIQRRRENQS